MADFKIGKIRFTWRGDWTAAHAYVKDDVVKYGAKTYVCMVTHTSSANFYTDLNNATTRWNEMIDGYEWTEDWAATTFYQLNDLVKYSGIVYRCITSHTSGATLETNIANWTVHFSGDDWNNAWTASTYYNVNDVVRWGGIVYRCNTAHTSATYAASATPSLAFRGLEYDQSKWTVVHDGVEWKGVYATDTRYKKGDIVRYNSSIWYCTTGYISEPALEETNFTLWLPGLSWEDAWTDAGTYTVGDVVSHGGYVYRAITNNGGQNPSTSPSDWQVVVENYRDRGEWSTTPTAYKVGDMVRWSGTTYVAIADNQEIEPPNASYWSVIIVTERFRGPWLAYDSLTRPYNYLVGDVVSFNSSAWLCVQKHQAAINNRPDDDPQGNYWQPFILGQASNVLESIGDLKSYGVTDDGSTIGVNRIAIGDNAEILRMTDGLPSWQPFYQSPKVYYVSPLGTDSGRIATDPLFGQTQDKPFASVKYACQYIQDDLAARAPATIFVKSGVYYESLPISVPATVSIVGDELRNPTIRPATGDETKDMFYMRNATTLRNMTLEGLSGTLGAANQYLTKRPTAGAYVSLDPGIGPNDTNTWITTRSPYVQNVTTFGTGCVGVKVDGNLHNGGNRSIVANDFTQVLSDGIGAWVTNNARSELVSVFTYYNHIGYLAENNGKIRATNGNNSYGDYGAVAEGDDPTEVPKTAVVNNRSGEALVEFVFTDGNEVLRYEYANAGINYTTATSTVAGTGLNAAASHNETRDGGLYQIRVAAPGDSSQPGGGGYVNVTGNAQTGDTTSITLSATDANDNGVYVGMRIIITSGLGVGQTGYVNSFSSTTKIAQIYKESTGTAGWDHIVPGTAIESTLDTTTAYAIEPRLTLAGPSFSNSSRTLPSSASWVDVVYINGRFISISSAGASIYSTNGTTWTAGGNLPTVATGWTALAAGTIGATDYVVAVSGGLGSNVAAYSTNGGVTWTSSTLPSTSDWGSIAFGNGRFIATQVSSGSSNIAYSTNGTTWTAGGTLGISGRSIAYGAGKFVILHSNGNDAYYTTDGISISTGTGSGVSGAYFGQVTYGNGLFVARVPGQAAAHVSKDGITWSYFASGRASAFQNISYGQGTFIATPTSGASTLIYSSHDGINWTNRTVANGDYRFALGNPGGSPIWAGVSNGTADAISIPNFTPAQARAKVTSGRISSVRIIEPGSGYTSNPVLTITDPNNTGELVTEIRRNNGVLANPSFTNRGSAYVTASATISGDGYADQYQTGSYVVVSNLTALPGPGANLNFATIDSPTYSVVSVDNLTGSTGNFSARLRITPGLDIDESPIHGEAIEIREQYSQCRITGHDFLEIGTGNLSETSYPNTNLTFLAPENEVVQSGGGRVFYTSTDQDGNFRVGELFEVEQATGIVSINADAFDLSGLSELRLGGVTLGGTGATVREFSTDPTFSANSNNIVPTQKAIKAYIASRIGGGGSDLDVNEIQAGSITFDAPNDIGHIAGDDINISAISNFKSGIRGYPLAFAYFRL